jgi:hypothetical protein
MVVEISCSTWQEKFEDTKGVIKSRKIEEG